MASFNSDVLFSTVYLLSVSLNFGTTWKKHGKNLSTLFLGFLRIAVVETVALHALHTKVNWRWQSPPWWRLWQPCPMWSWTSPRSGSDKPGTSSCWIHKPDFLFRSMSLYNVFIKWFCSRLLNYSGSEGVTRADSLTDWLQPTRQLRRKKDWSM